MPLYFDAKEPYFGDWSNSDVGSNKTTITTDYYSNLDENGVVCFGATPLSCTDDIYVPTDYDYTPTYQVSGGIAYDQYGAVYPYQDANYQSSNDGVIYNANGITVNDTANAKDDYYVTLKKAFRAGPTVEKEVKVHTFDYSVVFRDPNGNAYETQTVDYGESAQPPEPEEYYFSDGKVFKFDSWDGYYENITYGPKERSVYAFYMLNTPDYAFFDGNGTEDSPYLIEDDEDWKIFASYCNTFDTSGMYFKLTNDISTAKTAGKSGHEFKGNFDGGGKTITVNYSTDENVIAPFRYTSGNCVIKNLKVNGTINTSAKYAAGLIGKQSGNTTIENCRSSVTINSSTANNGLHGGLVALNRTGSLLDISGCVFDGKLLGENTNKCGGFIGSRNGTANITDSFFNPSEITIQSYNCENFAQGGANITNSYYYTYLNGEQGKRVYAITSSENTEIDFGESVKDYGTASGIVAYPNGFKCDDVFYAIPYARVKATFNYCGAPGYVVRSYNVTIYDDGCLVMPAHDLVIWANVTEGNYALSFDTDGGTRIGVWMRRYGQDISGVINNLNPTKTGYTFAGWTPEPPETMPPNDLELKANWTINQYTITIDPNNGEAVTKITQDYGTAVNAPADPTKTGNDFDGWDKDIPETMPAENITITAKFTPHVHTIHFDANGGSETADITQDYGTSITAPEDPIREGYTFIGWDTEIPETMPDEDVNITANWTINRYTLTFDTETEMGGTVIPPITADYGTKIEKPADPTLPRALFKGWDDLPETMPAENKTVTALWNWAVLYEAVEPNCTESGNKEYYKCNGKYYTVDENDYLVEIEDYNDIFLDSFGGHDWDEPNWSWGIHSYSGKLMATLNIECKVCGRRDAYNTTEFETEIVKEPTATEEGLKKYTAVIDVNGVEFTDEYTEAIYRTSAVATIGDTPYYRLIDAIEAVKSGDTITVLDDIDEPNVGYGDYPYIENDFTLDLNGHTVTAKSITTGNHLTIKNGTFNGAVGNNSGGGDRILTLENAKVNPPANADEDTRSIEWGALGIKLLSGSKLTVDNVEFYAGTYNDPLVFTMDSTSSVVFKNAKINVADDSADSLYEIEKYLPAGYSLKYDDEKYCYYIADADGNKVTDSVELLAANFVVNKVEAKAATCEQNGCIEHYEDTHGNFFADKDGTQKLSEKDVVIPAVGHNWGEPAYEWAYDYSTCTRTKVCQNDGTHKTTDRVNTTIEGTTATAVFNDEVTKYSHTSNINDKGEQDGDYDNGLDTKETVKIDGAQKLKVTLKYNTENDCDFVYVFKNADDTEPMTITEDEKEISLKLSGEDTKTFEVEGDSVTFGFTSDGGVNAYGYYATVTAELPDVQIKEVSEIPLLGDVNFDKKVDDKDAAMVLEYISTGKKFFEDDTDKNAKAIKAANFDGIGNVDMLDVIAILQKSKQA
ncbi:MAG: InlB B-repeat-containing protein [Firmicutes bacterium]|nr:InlB B-repeat-containing protein [Bacillota bacterium]